MDKELEANLQDIEWINNVESIHEIFDRDTLNGIYGPGGKRCKYCHEEYFSLADKAFMKLRHYCYGCSPKDKANIDLALFFKLAETL